MESNVNVAEIVKKEVKNLTLGKEHELRIEVDFGQTIAVKVLEGTAESFGNELAHQKEYEFSATKFAIFSWNGAKIEITGPCHSYVATETPMTQYLNVFDGLDKLRAKRSQEKKEGPKVVLVGPTDSGKSSLCKLLLNWSIRKDFQPTFIDLDVGQGSITIPGALAAITLDLPISTGKEESNVAPLAYFFGRTSPGDNVKLYKALMANLMKDVEKKFETNEIARVSGCVVNTCGWVDGIGYEILLNTIEVVNADLVLVLDHDRLFADLTSHFSQVMPSLKILKLPKSGGVVTRDVTFRRKTRMGKIREYFYGVHGDLCPHNTVVSFADISVWRIGSLTGATTSSLLPLGQASAIDPLKVLSVTPSPDLLHSLLAVVYCTSADQILSSNVAGYVYVTEINVEKQRLTLMVPCPGPLPTKFLLAGTLKWLE